MSDGPTTISHHPGKSLRILVVEDHGDTRRTLSQLLSHFGHEISAADSKRSALEMIAAKKFDVLLSDIALPDGTGYEVMSEAKRDQHIKGVALSGLDKDEDISRGKEAGFDYYLSKPVDFHELRTILGDIGA